MGRRRAEQFSDDCGHELKCSKCGEFWPADSEFFYCSKGRISSWCIACYLNYIRPRGMRRQTPRHGAAGMTVTT